MLGIFIAITVLIWFLLFALSPQPKYQRNSNINIPKLPEPVINYEQLQKIEYKEVDNYRRSMGLKDGGRVNRQMGSPMMAEQPMEQGMEQMPTEQKDVAMETQGNQGNQVYAMLRARLPQEVSDEVVKLISYNKEAFGDFASIKNQEDVNSFNEKYGVQLVIDVATV